MHEQLKPVPIPIPIDPPQCQEQEQGQEQGQGQEQRYGQILHPVPTAQWQDVGTGPGTDPLALATSAFGAHINAEHTAFWTLSNLYAVQVKQ